MDAQILQDVPVQDRKQLLRDSAVKKENFTYPRPLENDEITHIKDEYTKNAIHMAKHEEEKKQYMTAYKAEVKPLKEKMQGQMSLIRSRVEEITEEVFLLAEQTEGLMLYYNSLGALVYHRPLMPDEKQLRIVPDIETRKAK